MGGSVNLFWRKFRYSVPPFPAENTWTAMMLEKDFAKLKWQETKQAVTWHDYWFSCVQVTVPFRVLVLNSVPWIGPHWNIYGSGYSSGSRRQVIHAIHPAQPRDINTNSIQQMTAGGWPSLPELLWQSGHCSGSQMHFYWAIVSAIHYTVAS